MSNASDCRKKITYLVRKQLDAHIGQNTVHRFEAQVLHSFFEGGWIPYFASNQLEVVDDPMTTINRLKRSKVGVELTNHHFGFGGYGWAWGGNLC